jgi:phage baseplate assembly protein W
MPYQIVSTTNQAQQQNGIDISFNSTVPFATIFTTQLSVFGKLKNLLLTRLGERPLQPNFGTDLFKILFEVNSDELQQEIENYILPKISYWIPEVNVNEIQVKTNSDDPTMEYSIIISINYTVNGINTSSLTLTANESGMLQIQQGQ